VALNFHSSFDTTHSLTHTHTEDKNNAPKKQKPIERKERKTLFITTTKVESFVLVAAAERLS